LTGHLSLHIEGASPADLARGLQAALRVLHAHGMTPAEADHGRWRRDCCEALGLAADPRALSRRDALAAWAWDEAVEAAAMAACPTPASSRVATLRLASPEAFGVGSVVEIGG
jgi:hypothetical protein